MGKDSIRELWLLLNNSQQAGRLIASDRATCSPNQVGCVLCKGCCSLAVVTVISVVNPFLSCKRHCLANCLAVKMFGKHWSCHLSNQSAYFHFGQCACCLSWQGSADCSEYAQQMCVGAGNLVAAIPISNQAVPRTQM